MRRIDGVRAEPGSVITGQVDWRSTVHLDDAAAIKCMPKGGSAKDGFDIPDPQSKWAGWVTPIDAVSGKQH